MKEGDFWTNCRLSLCGRAIRPTEQPLFEYREPDAWRASQRSKNSMRLKSQATSSTWTRYVALKGVSLASAPAAQVLPGPSREPVQSRSGGSKDWRSSTGYCARSLEAQSRSDILSRATTLVHILGRLAKVCRTRAETCGHCSSELAKAERSPAAEGRESQWPVPKRQACGFSAGWLSLPVLSCWSRPVDCRGRRFPFGQTCRELTELFLVNSRGAP